MTLLVAREFAPGRYEKLARVRSTKAGRCTIPAKLRGTVAAELTKSAARTIAADPAIASVDVAFGTFRGRVARID